MSSVLKELVSAHRSEGVDRAGDREHFTSSIYGCLGGVKCAGWEFGFNDDYAAAQASDNPITNREVVIECFEARRLLAYDGSTLFYDAFAEFGNICCGQLNRELGHYFPHLGMSTPNVLETECLGYMSSLNGKHVQHFKVVINDSITFYAALCVCNDDTIDFAVRAVEPDTSTGELELF